ncbi:trypsin-like peptidase domain-containing protein [bacterium]|nr:trypsin-like peptidase domain-containing protein [bacterium]
MDVYLDHLQGERAGTLDRFAADVIRVGRNAEFELCFDDLGVSFEHAELRQRDGDVWLVDRGSTNGCYVNDERAQNTRLREGDVVRFGKKGPVVRFRLSAPASKEKPPPAPEPPARKVSERFKLQEALPDLPPLAPAIPRRPKIPTSPQMAAVAPEALARDEDLSSGGSSGLKARRAGERLMVLPRKPSAAPLVAICILSVLVVVGASTSIVFWMDSERKRTNLEEERRLGTEARRGLEDLKRVMAEREREGHAAEARMHEDLRAQVEHLEQSLERERTEARKNQRESNATITQLREELARTKLEVAKATEASAGRDNSGWKVIQKRVARSVVLVACSFNLKKKDGTTEHFSCTGSGFFISKDGYICTNKHVVEPWKFRQLATRLVQEDLEVDQSTYVLAVWIAGTQFAVGNQFNLATGYSTTAKTLEKVRAPNDRWTQASLPGDKSPRFMVHDDSSNEDLALLKATGGPFDALPLRRSSEGQVEKLDQVMIIGFPAGPAILEKGIAETSPSLGQVRKVEETITVSNAATGGNSGGPLLDSEGRVVGVITRIVNGTEGLGICLKAQHVVELLEGGSW